VDVLFFIASILAPFPSSGKRLSPYSLIRGGGGKSNIPCKKGFFFLEGLKIAPKKKTPWASDSLF
jgi:hypothetical protein